MKTSPLYRLNLQDVGKGLIIAIAGGFISAIEVSFSAGSFTFNWKQIGMTALASGVAYLVKNFFTPAKLISDDAVK
ncbi:hypothetical protein [Mucilaginibacter boryungensis]|uniref:Holin n=1 Tax=Mucilaginibacter boryungensis TaxID=768480 RepID=A0ABR9XK76_9SPHI|nr:hypothetical protein [Mucilaginibacter boryungensis]MBE9667793.1 hypothetical protein [Mucilaginibacter boryungensis]